jgi:hypothetical protein
MKSSYYMTKVTLFTTFLITLALPMLASGTPKSTSSAKHTYDGAYELTFYQTTLSNTLSKEKFSIPFHVEASKVHMDISEGNQIIGSLSGKVSHDGRLTLRGNTGYLTVRGTGFIDTEGQVYGAYFARKVRKSIEGQFHGQKITATKKVNKKSQTSSINLGLFTQLLFQ